MQLYSMDLQLLADGAAAGGEAAGDGAAAGTTGVTAPDAGEQTQQPRTSRQAERMRRKQRREAQAPALQAAQPDAAGAPDGTGQAEGAAPGAGEQQPETAQAEERKSFDALIKGEYKQEFDARVQDILRKRFREDDARKERDGKIQELMLTLAELTGQKIDEGAEIDPEALRQALLKNEGIVDAAAMEAGVGTDQYLQQLRMRTENATMRQQLAGIRQAQQQEREQERSRRAFDALQQEAEALRQARYPELDFTQLIENAQAVRTLQALQAAGAANPVRTVYEMLHRDDILAGVTQAAKQQATQQVAASVAANRARPQENGGKAQGGLLTGVDVKNLSRQQRKDIRQRVARGERIIL